MLTSDMMTSYYVAIKENQLELGVLTEVPSSRLNIYRYIFFGGGSKIAYTFKDTHPTVNSSHTS